MRLRIRNKLKKIVAAILTALLLLSACPALTLVPAEAKAARTKKARVAKTKKTTKIRKTDRSKKSSKSRKSVRSKKSSKSKKSNRSKKRAGGSGRGIGVYITRPQLRAGLAKKSPAPVADGKFTDSKSVKTITTHKSDKHQELFGVPVWIAPASGYSFAQVSRSCCADAKKKISLEASELEVPYAKLLAEFTPARLKSAGVALKSRAKFVWNGAAATLMKAYQKNGGAAVGKWLLIIDRGEKSWMISGNFAPKDEERGKAVLQMLKTVCWDDEGEEEARRQALLPTGSVRTEGTPFTLAGIRQDAFIYTKDARLPTKSPDGALFVLSRLLETRFTDDDRLAFAKKNLEDVENGKPLEIVSQGAIAAGGLSGVEITAYTSDGRSKLVYEAMLFDASETCVMVGISRGDSLDSLAQFRQLAASYTRNLFGR
jgi:hypothetical protein